MTQKLADKILVLGVDGLDPRLAKKMMDEGKLPHIKEYVERGGCREDLVLLGGLPTITPPMWTTLATGAYPSTHGITCFWGQDPESLDTIVYNLDSTRCQAEQIWNVLAEDADMKTLVWHWPGSSWPPTSTSPNLHVVEGTQPAAINFGIAKVDPEEIVYASTEITEAVFEAEKTSDTGAGCIINDLETEEPSDSMSGQEFLAVTMGGGKGLTNIETKLTDGEMAGELGKMNGVNSPIKEAYGWANAPKGAKEFTILIMQGFAKRPALLLPNETGRYTQVAVYKSKKDEQPLVTLKLGEMHFNVLDEYVDNGQKVTVNRHYKLFQIAEDGSAVSMWLSDAYDTTKDTLFYPHSLFSQVVENVGYVPPMTAMCGTNPLMVEEKILPAWRNYDRWQAETLMYLIQANGYQAVFSHLHNVDCIGHQIWRLAKARAEHPDIDPQQYQGFLEQVYQDTDDYLGHFLPLLDEGWTIIITSDHGLLVSEEEYLPLAGDPFGVNTGVLGDLGYTVLKKDASGKTIKEIDWSQTKAVAPRGNHIYLNIKGRDAYGIVDPADQYALEEEIISALYNYRNADGQRVFSVVLRNKEAAILGMDGPECGDLIYFIAEGFNRIHGDSLSTYQGYFSSSVSPIFIAAGKGIKQGYTDRVIRQVDVAPTIAALVGTRMPHQSEGSVVHQILDC